MCSASLRGCPLFSIQPLSFRVHNKRVAFPLAGRISHPGRKRSRRKFAPIDVNLTKDSVCFAINCNLFLSLEDLEGKGQELDSRNAQWQAVRRRSIHRLYAPRCECGSFRPNGRFFLVEVDKKVEKLLRKGAGCHLGLFGDTATVNSFHLTGGRSSICQTPERYGLPSLERGVLADRFGLPSFIGVQRAG